MSTGTSTSRRVRFLVHGAERSGPPIYVLRLLRQWAASPPGFAPEVVLGRGGPLVESFDGVAPTTVARLDRDAPAQVAARVAERAHAGAIGSRVRTAAIRSRVRGPEPDLTLVNGATAPTIELLRSIDPAHRVATIAHELSTGWYANIDAADRDYLLRRSAAFLAVSTSVREFLVSSLGVDESTVVVVPPPVDGRELPERPAGGAGPRMVAGCGVTDWRKAPELWLAVAASVTSRPAMADVRFVWAGGDPGGSTALWPLDHEARQLGVDHQVEFLGDLAAPWQSIGSADVLVSTAREDAYPLACAEAIAAGIPVAGFDVDGVGEMVTRSGCGVVVPYPRVDALADAVAGLLADDAARADMARRGRAFARRSTDATVVAPLIAGWIESQLGAAA